MKQLVIGVLLGVGLVMLASGATSVSSPVFAQHGTMQDGGSELTSLTTQLPNGSQQLTLIDSRQRVVSVYHIGPNNGEIVLKSVRNIHWDLQMTQFNGVSPLPKEIRALSEQR